MPALDPSAYLVSEDRGLDAFDPADTGPFSSEDEAREAMEEAARDGSLWEQRYRQIRDVERYLVENGVHLVKLFLHVSKEEQRQRLLDRIERPEKRWDFSRADVEKRDDWDAFQSAYDDALRATSTDHAPWYVIPADRKWFARATAAAIISDALRRLHGDRFPEPDDEQQALLDWGRDQLQSDA